jgi:hypothetical protein
MIAAHEAEIAACHQLLAERLRALGDAADADILASLAADASARAAAVGAGACAAEACTADRPLGLLIAGQRPLERLCDALESVLVATPDEAARLRAEQALESALARLARLGRRIEQLEPG